MEMDKLKELYVKANDSLTINRVGAIAKRIPYNRFASLVHDLGVENISTVLATESYAFHKGTDAQELKAESFDYKLEKSAYEPTGWSGSLKKALEGAVAGYIANLPVVNEDAKQLGELEGKLFSYTLKMFEDGLNKFLPFYNEEDIDSVIRELKEIKGEAEALMKINPDLEGLITLITSKMPDVTVMTVYDDPLSGVLKMGLEVMISTLKMVKMEFIPLIEAEKTEELKNRGENLLVYHTFKALRHRISNEDLHIPARVCLPHLDQVIHLFKEGI